MDWLMALPGSIWQNARELPEIESKGMIYVDLVKFIWEMGMRQAMFNLNTCEPDDECFITHMKDLILPAAPPAAFGLLAAILTTLVDHEYVKLLLPGLQL